MSAYLGYVKQDVDSQVNWGEVGKTFTDMLSAESKRREDLKTEIDDNTRTDLEKLANIPKGSSEEYNKWTTDAADKISQARLLQVKELKAGRLSLKDYNNYRQNTVSGVNNMVATVKSYNAWYEEGMKRAESKEAGAAELWKNSLLESMKFRDTIPNIALDGTMSVTKKVMNPKTGLMEVSTNPADAFTFSSMLDFGKKKFNRFKAKETLDDLSKVVGQYTKALNQGNVETRTSVFQKDAKGNFINPQVDAIKNQVKSSIANPNDAMSVLVDFKGTTPSGEPYEFTLDADDPRLKGAGRDNIILLDKATMNPQLTANQLKRAEDIMIEGLMSRSDVIETPREIPTTQSKSLTSAEIEADEKKNIYTGYLQDIKTLSTGSSSEFQAVANDRIADMNRYFKEEKIDTQYGIMTRSGDKFILPITSNGKTINQIIPRGKNIDQPSRALLRYLTPYKGSYESLIKATKGSVSMTGTSNIEKAAAGQAFTEKPEIAFSRVSSGEKGQTFSSLFSNADNRPGSMADIAQQALSTVLKGIQGDVKVYRDGFNIIVKLGKNKPLVYDYSKQDKAAFESEIQKLANSQIRKYNEYRRNKEASETNVQSKGELD
jgi:hypothetical protein